MNARGISITKVATRAGVSTDTVSRVLNDSTCVPPAVARRVLQAVAEVEYLHASATKQVSAASRPDGQALVIGMVLADASNLYQAAIAAAAREEAVRQGVALNVANSRGGRVRQWRNVEMFLEQRVFGIIVVSAGGSESVPHSRFPGPTVFVESSSVPASYSSVSADNVAGGRLAAHHLLKEGRRRITFVSSSLIPQSAQRLYGARAALETYPDARLDVIAAESNTGTAGVAVGDALALQEDGRIPDAVICANDSLAAGMLQSTRLQDRVRIPEDVALIGFDDSPFAVSTRVPLSSIRFPAQEVGKAAVQLLQRKSAAPQHLRFNPSLVQRESSGTAHTGPGDSGGYGRSESA